MFAIADLRGWGRGGVRPAGESRDFRMGASAALEGVSYGVARSGGSGGDRAGETLSILEDISLTIRPGEFVCLLGPSGSGKSTVLNLLAGLLRPTAGTVTAAGAAVIAPGAERALVFQEAALFPWLRLRENIEFPLRVQGLSAAARALRSEELLRLVHLYRFRDSYPHELSGGMRQRGAIARALAIDPSLLLMDEPFAALDTQTREILQSELERIWLTTKKTVVFVTHNVDEAVRLADRIVLMGTRPGRILQDFIIDVPRPRSERAAATAPLAAAIREILAGEVDKIAREEADDAWAHERNALHPGIHRALGGRV